MIVWLILQSCLFSVSQEQKPVQDQASLSIVGQPWVLLESTGYQPTAHKIVLEFFDNNQLDLDCNCNDNYGRYTVDGTTLKVSEIGGTEKACVRPPFDSPETIYDDESFLMRFLLESPTIGRDGELLILSTADTTLTLGPEMMLPPEPKKVVFYDTIWRIDGISTIDDPIVRLQDGSPSVVFDPHGTFTLQTGCNEGAGKYTVLSDSIEIELINFTGYTCSPNELSQIDAALNKQFSRSTFTVHKETGKMIFSSKEVEISMEAKQSE